MYLPTFRVRKDHAAPHHNRIDHCKDLNICVHVSVLLYSRYFDQKQIFHLAVYTLFFFGFLRVSQHYPFGTDISFFVVSSCLSPSPVSCLFWTTMYTDIKWWKDMQHRWDELGHKGQKKKNFAPPPTWNISAVLPAYVGGAGLCYINIIIRYLHAQHTRICKPQVSPFLTAA